MKTRTLKQLLLYNYRYLFAYLIIIGFVAYFLGWQLGHIGPGLSGPELNTAARHLNLSDIIHQPIYPLQAVLQWISIKAFGVSIVALRLPSVLIAILVAVCLYNLLKKWFGKQTALLSTAIFISADWFLFTARQGTGSIEFSLWLVLALVCFTKLLEHKTQWLVLFSLTLVGLLFTPLGPYAAITFFASLFSCRIFRERAVEAKPLVKIGAVSVLVVGLAASIYTSVINIEFLKNIFNVSQMPGIGQFFKNVIYNTAGVVAILPDANPAISPTGVFFVRFFELIFILFGVIMLWRTRVNRLNLTVLVLSVVLVVASGLSSGSRGGSIVLIPAAIYMTAGIRHLMHRWKRTFPKNPYARVAAFLPLGVLFFFIVALHYVSYFDLWPSQTATHYAFSQDVPLLQKELNRSRYSNKRCYVQTPDMTIQKLIRASKTRCTPYFVQSVTTPADTLVLSPDVNKSTYPDRIFQPLVGETKEGNVRWIVAHSPLPQ